MQVWINTEVSDDHKHTVAHTKNYTKVLLKRDDTLVGCTAQVEIVSSSRFHVNGVVVSRSEPATEAAAAIRDEILARGRQSLTEQAKLLSIVDVASSASCGGDGGCGTCEEDLEDTCAPSSGGCSSGGSGCGGNGSGCGGGGGSGKSGCCGGSGGSGCCSSGSKSKYKKTKTKTKAPSVGVQGETEVPAMLPQPTKLPASFSFGDRLCELYEDKIALAAVATIVASTLLVTTRLVVLARK